MSFLDSVPIVGSYRKSNRAEEMVADAKRRHRRSNRKLIEANTQSHKLVEQLFDLKTFSAIETIPNAIQTLEKCQKVNNSETKVSKDVIDSFKTLSVPKLNAQTITANEALTAGVKGTASGAALSLGSLGAVSAYGAASTGTSIAALSGAAAQNATIAWFGGGALTAGGAGMAGGAMVLGGIALAPLAIIGAFKYASHAEKKLTEAQSFRNQVNEAVEKIDAAIQVASTLNSHVILFQETLEKIRSYLVNATNTLTTLLQNNFDQDELDRAKFTLILFIKAAKRLLAVNLFTANQEPTDESKRIISHAQHTTNKTIKPLIEKVTSDQVIEPPVHYLKDMKPGPDSPSFFWMLDSYDEYKQQGKIKAEHRAKRTPTLKQTIFGMLTSASIGALALFYFQNALIFFICLLAFGQLPLFRLAAVKNDTNVTNLVNLAFYINICITAYFYIKLL
ncbi:MULTISPECIES: hypothetical protein [unclassified Pseudoalteromonas]|jgi:hypothetical protein|uniref:hypothetical protein n=1 Tax=unclassified Pseudoalteromonas TaxID=194690 RepID=UPI001602E0F9|nr:MULTISPECIES: hypothetical protein [unclassified Pseudoalteromonas]MBB1351240.1 hypothetical protein [Pseudoalteromonas sp. SG45-3]MBB1358658.1 hypothetical protein [Pseudoalteromonas sp. SG45-6]